MRNIVRRGQTYFAVLHVPRARQADVAVAYAARGAKVRDRTRTLETRDPRVAQQRLPDALEAMRREVDAKLRAARLPPLGTGWVASWADRALTLRESLRAASDEPRAFDEDAETGLRAPVSDHSLLEEEISEEAREVYVRHGARAAGAFYATATARTLSVAEARDAWLLEVGPKLRRQTVAGHRTAFDTLGAFLRERAGLPSLAVVSLDDMSRRLAGEFVAWRRAQVSAATVRRELSAPSGLWRWAIRRGYAEANPWHDQGAGLSDPRRPADGEGGDTGSKRAYTPEELVALLRATAEDWAPNGGGYGAAMWDVVRLGLLTGCRANELAGLRVRDVTEGGTALAVRGGKTQNARRTVPLCEPAQRVVAARLASLADRTADAPLWPELPPGGADGKRSKPLVSRFVTARRRILPEAVGVDLHSLRRCFATALETAMHAGGRINPTIIAALMGHERGTLALNRYSAADRLQPKRDAMADMLALGLPEEVHRALAETAEQRPVMVRQAPAYRRPAEAPSTPTGDMPRAARRRGAGVDVGAAR